MAITERRGLLNELQANALATRRGGISRLVPRTNHDANFLNSRRKDFFDENPQRRLGLPVAVHQRLQRQRALRFAGGGDYGLFDFHALILALRKRTEALQNAAGWSTPKFQRESTRIQTPGSREAPNSKVQAPNKFRV